ncbi:hypothetical protein PI125_g11119 [Phytophthora idaei]|nr:hypothetical protein PI125_g11119 [Phytophthora idaei]
MPILATSETGRRQLRRKTPPSDDSTVSALLQIRGPIPSLDRCIKRCEVTSRVADAGRDWPVPELRSSKG